MNEENIKVITTNRKARHDYFIEDTLEAGLVLTGSEIKSIRAGHVNLREAYVAPRYGEMWLLNMHISSYDRAGYFGHEPLRPRKLLLRRREIDRWADKVQTRGYTIVPLRLYLRHGRAKIEIGLARGKRQYDKRRAIADRDAQRRIDRELGEHRRRRGE
jgi:SsrA-binding protein